MSLSKNVLYYGKDELLPERIPLRAGPLTLLYENGDLRYICLGEREILRRLYIAIRDQNWGTVLPKLSNFQVDIAEDTFRIAYEVENIQGDIDFFWRGTISGDAAGTIRMVMDGVARSSFRRNRIGFSVLHPMDLAGSQCRIFHVDGSKDEVDFPISIARQLYIDGEIKPVIPFNEMAAMTYPVGKGVEAEIRFEGDIFEMEDQRNWTDASYKTYCTPLRFPFPKQIEKGTKIRQAVTVTLTGDTPPGFIQKTEDQRLKIAVGGAATKPLPAIGLGMASHGQPLTEIELSRLKALHISHLRVGIRPSAPGWESKLAQASNEVEAIDAGLEVAIFLSDQAKSELEELVSQLLKLRPPVRHWLVFYDQENSTSAKWIELARQHLAAYDPTIPVGSGTNQFFTELNRDRPPITSLDLVCYTINPQVHAFDNLSLIETLQAQAATVASARLFCGDRQLAVTPVTLRMRFNPNATGPEPDPAPGELPPQVDVRQMSLFGAGWTLGSLKNLIESDVHSLTYFETTGWRGLMETEQGSPLPDLFPSIPRSVFPMYHIFADVGEFVGGDVRPVHSSDSLLVEALGLVKADKSRIILANLSHEVQQLTVEGLPERVTIYMIDENNAKSAMLAPEAFRMQPVPAVETLYGTINLTLLPFAIARIDY